jgi:hypothetical protein
MHPGKKQQKSLCFKLLIGTQNFLRRSFIATNLNLYKTSRAEIQAQIQTVLESLSLDLSACDHKEFGAGYPAVQAQLELAVCIPNGT